MHITLRQGVLMEIIGGIALGALMSLKGVAWPLNALM